MQVHVIVVSTVLTSSSSLTQLGQSQVLPLGLLINGKQLLWNEQKYLHFCTLSSASGNIDINQSLIYRGDLEISSTSPEIPGNAHHQCHLEGIAEDSRI